MNTHTFSWLRFASLLLLTTAISGYGSIARASLVVANNGTDSSSCGSTASPCRSISQAIQNAASGETIWVGPGIYGDLNGDGNFDAPGSEHATVFNSGANFNDCVVCIMKTVQIYSYTGAATTTIQVGPNSISTNTVLIAANKVVFGAKGHGFTITGGNAKGIVVDLEQGGGATGGMTVEGNIDLKDGTGFLVNGERFAMPLNCPPINQWPCVPPVGLVLLSGNEAIGNGTGFYVEPKLAAFYGTQPFVLQDNIAIGAGTGFFVDKGNVDCDDCFDAGRAQVVTLTNNFAVDGGTGFNLRSTGLVSGNFSANNSVFGFVLTDVPKFVRNSAIGNAGPGALVGFLLGGSNVAILFQNNFFGNDRNRPPLIVGFTAMVPAGVNPGPSAHCGVLNAGWVDFNGAEPPPIPPTPFPVTSVHATNTYWGSVNGPQTNGAGDAAGGVCDVSSVFITTVTPTVTISKPFAATPNGTTAAPFGP